MQLDNQTALYIHNCGGFLKHTVKSKWLIQIHMQIKTKSAQEQRMVLYTSDHQSLSTVKYKMALITAHLNAGVILVVTV